jgi:hypothetical protein
MNAVGVGGIRWTAVTSGLLLVLLCATAGDVFASSFTNRPRLSLVAHDSSSWRDQGGGTVHLQASERLKPHLPVSGPNPAPTRPLGIFPPGCRGAVPEWPQTAAVKRATWLRRGPSIRAARITRVHRGSVISVCYTPGEPWSPARWGRFVGYVRSNTYQFSD